MPLVVNFDTTVGETDPFASQPVSEVIIIVASSGKIFIEPTDTQEQIPPDRATKEVRPRILRTAVNHLVRTVPVQRDNSGEDSRGRSHKGGQLLNCLWVYVLTLGVLQDHDITRGRADADIIRKRRIAKLSG
jgi:hypothetical protein